MIGNTIMTTKVIKSKNFVNFKNNKSMRIAFNFKVRVKVSKLFFSWKQNK